MERFRQWMESTLILCYREENEVKSLKVCIYLANVCPPHFSASTAALESSAEPIKTFIETITCGRAGCLDAVFIIKDRS